MDLSEIAEYYYDVAELYEDEDLDPADHLEVVKRAFTSSHCDDFAAVLSDMTGYPVVNASWTIPGFGFGHHAMVRAPDGRALDVSGWVDEDALRKRYGVKKTGEMAWKDGHGPSTVDVQPEEADMMRVLVGLLPYAPFDEPSFRKEAGIAEETAQPTP